jgi:hypothetical protein
MFSVLCSCSETIKTKKQRDIPSAKTIAPVKKMGETAPKVRTNVSRYTAATFLQPDGWGYYISETGKQIIHQETIPGVPGNQGFQSSEEAMKVAELVRSKMENGTFPPTISEEELQKLGISWRN